MKVRVLIDDINENPALSGEHGLSIYVETGERNILFDFGATDKFIRNAEILGIDLSKVDFCVLSHGHYDHGGGMKYFAEINPNAGIYVGKTAFEGHFHNGRDISVEKSEDFNLITVDRPIKIAGGITVFPASDGGKHPIRNENMTKVSGGKETADDFLPHEIYLTVETDGKTTLFGGCSHRGISNVAEAYPFDIFVGGFHLNGLNPVKNADAIADTAKILLASPAKYYTCHCTGRGCYEKLKEFLGGRIEYLSTGEGFIAGEEN